MFCANCGTALDSGDKFCRQCGSAVAEVGFGSSSPADSNASATSFTSPSPAVAAAVAAATNPQNVTSVSDTDSTLRLIAFILNLISCVTAGLATLGLACAWMVPMSVRSWHIYKGERPNTVAFGVCTLLFLNLIGGILLLVSTKDEK